MRIVKCRDGTFKEVKATKAQTGATRKYRRLKTIIQKILEVCTIAKLKMVLYVWEPKKTKLREFYTHNDLKSREISAILT